MGDRAHPSPHDTGIAVTQLAEHLAARLASTPTMPPERLRSHARALAASVLADTIYRTNLRAVTGAVDRFIEDNWAELVSLARQFAAQSAVS